ncbi:hypothetical protein ILYODFUR_021034 [Ilyodon furcidens]|uniref:UPAR/Ly6 domain-containing protein n=1 Tax=Ilyodon furcidens TaxID=33524 RepID=A0ABV0UTV0_9TELE
MNNFWTTVIALSAVIATAQCLQCRQCPVAVFGNCLFGKDVTCSEQESCAASEARFNATGSPTLHSRGCLFSSFCGRTLTGTLIGATYTSTFSCCDTDLCNGATSVQLSLTVALSVALLSSLWGFWEL